MLENKDWKWKWIKLCQAKPCPRMDQPWAPLKNSIQARSSPDLPSTRPRCLLEASDTLWSLQSHLPAQHKRGKPPGHCSPWGSRLLSSRGDQWLRVNTAVCQLSLAPANTVQEKPGRPLALWGRRHQHLLILYFLSSPHLAKELRAAHSTALLWRKLLPPRRPDLNKRGKSDKASHSLKELFSWLRYRLDLFPLKHGFCYYASFSVILFAPSHGHYGHQPSCGVQSPCDH